jgi:predicted MFS family arabinose efflux permease
MMVALMQTATSLPIFLLALPAGALADVIDRRRMLLFTQGWMLVAAAGLGVLTVADATTPWVLLMLTFALGIGAAMNAPAWQAVIPEMVPRSELSAATALGSVGFNLARAVGPALGGFIVAAAGTGTAFLLNAASFLGVVVVLYRWQRAPRESISPAERIVGAMRAGIRYVRHAPALRAVLVRVGAFIFGASALWSLLPHFARQELRLSAIGYGVVLGCLGAGAVAGAAILTKMQRRFSVGRLFAGGTILFAAVTVALAYLREFGLVCTAMLAGGIAWITLMSILNVAAQMAVPSWVRARALAVYLLVFQGGMAAGSVLWGAIAAHAGITVAFVCAAIVLLVGLAATARYRLITGEELDLTPSMHWPVPPYTSTPHPDGGPVLVSVEYRIDPARATEFAAAMRAVRQQRLRDGAIRWGLFRDVADPGRYIENFLVESWAEHLRQHERITVADREAEDRARSFHIGAEPLIISHLIYAYDEEEKRS